MCVGLLSLYWRHTYMAVLHWSWQRLDASSLLISTSQNKQEWTWELGVQRECNVFFHISLGERIPSPDDTWHKLKRVVVPRCTIYSTCLLCLAHWKISVPNFWGTWVHLSSYFFLILVWVASKKHWNTGVLSRFLKAIKHQKESFMRTSFIRCVHRLTATGEEVKCQPLPRSNDFGHPSGELLSPTVTCSQVHLMGVSQQMLETNHVRGIFYLPVKHTHSHPRPCQGYWILTFQGCEDFHFSRKGHASVPGSAASSNSKSLNIILCLCPCKQVLLFLVKLDSRIMETNPGIGHPSLFWYGSAMVMRFWHFFDCQNMCPGWTKSFESCSQNQVELCRVLSS